MTEKAADFNQNPIFDAVEARMQLIMVGPRDKGVHRGLDSGSLFLFGTLGCPSLDGI
jgi:hypothetical protein